MTGTFRLFTAAVAVMSLTTAAPAKAEALRDVVIIGNSAGGTASFLDGRTFTNLGSVNLIPDLKERLDAMNPIERAIYEIVKQQAGGDKFVDDAHLSPDGRTLYASRGNLGDVIAYDLAGRRIAWRVKLDGHKADHATLSRDGSRFVVSAITAQKSQVIDTATGTVVNSFPTGTYPHENIYSANGERVYNASIGTTSFPKALNGLKGLKQLTVADARTWQVLRTYQFEYGIRPAVITPDERTMYAQLSYLNGFVEYDLVEGRITRTVEMPFSTGGQALNPDQYPQNSAHHGMAMSGDGSKLCMAGTIDDYTAIVSRPGLTTDAFQHYAPKSLPYWATTSIDGNHCFVTLSNTDEVSVVDYRTAREVARVPVGDYPQRERLGRLAEGVIGGLSRAVG
ncbi:serine/threonine protein kinase [Allokutzneria sp. A3M-2-11 16]|uniref:YncE family protein n=1 Tax=Allokutzneria sp. A3M-2-11 16 TaxID=2962043 RepID=UPI0020B82D43|nr:serine/threonine protein kinase [Allokutzneria sp. A3M-2-11 16]MCP3801410.1 serine/threonine protein kinase [Allokutzneria sp. A3M-2-11 16]